MNARTQLHCSLAESLADDAFDATSFCRAVPPADVVDGVDPPSDATFEPT